MSTSPSTPDVNAPKLFTLTGKNHQCYQAGVAVGLSRASLATVKTIELLKEPHTNEDVLTLLSKFNALAVEQQQEGSQILARVAAQDTAAEARWRPPLRAWAMLAAGLTVATTVATIAARYAILQGW